MEFFDLTIFEMVVRATLGLVIGFCIGLTGVGGGVLVLPALTLFLRMNAVMAVGTASLYAFLTKVSATFHHAKLKTIDWMLSLLFLVGAIPVNFLTARWIAAQGNNDEFIAGLKKFIIATVFFCVAIMIYNLMGRIRSDKDAKTVKSQFSDHIEKNPILRRILGVTMGGVVGALIGATSIGGGVLIVPMLIILFGLEARRTVGSSIFIAVALTLVTSLSYFSGENSMDSVTAAVMAVGSLIGVPIGSRLSVKMPEKLLQGVMIGLIFIAAVMMLCNGGGH
jgi:uncharacterized membrane protein YfcA